MHFNNIEEGMEEVKKITHFFWAYSTVAPKSEQANLLEANGANVLNSACLDISKQHVENTFKSVFGYSTEVDPLNYKGKFIMKPNRNSDGRSKVFENPLDVLEPDCVYQRLIDNINSEGNFIDYRTVIIAGSIPCVFEVVKTKENRFGGSYKNYVSYKCFEANEIFSEDERSQILHFCKRMNLDYGELDILRDNIDGKIFVVDVNTTPGGERYAESERYRPRDYILSGMHREKSLQKIGDAFESLVL